MHRGLIKLIRLQARAVFRRMFRGAKSPRGVIFLIISTVVFLGWFIGTISSAMLVPRADPQLVRTYFPLAMLGFCVMTLVTTAGERAIAFTPAEVDFLFPGPFSRRELLGYKIVRSAISALFTATLFSFVFLRYARHWASGWIGIFLALIFMQLLAMAVVLIGQTVGERAYTRARKLAIAAIVIAISAIVLPSRLGSTPHSAQELAFEFTHSSSGRAVLAPFGVFAQILSADRIAPDALKWAGVAVVMVAVLLLIVMRLDAHYLESAARTGEQTYNRMQRFRRGGGVAYRASSARLRLPMLPRLAGAGAIAWRQLLTAIRTAKAMLIVLLIICISIGPTFYFTGFHSKIENVIVGVMMWVTFVLSNMLRFDFRGDLDHIDTLKALPVSLPAIALAQLVAPVAMLTLCQAVLLISIGVVLHADAQKLLMVMAFALPMNALLIAVENLIFLVFPVRSIAVSPGDLQGFGRQMLVFLLKTLALLFAATLAGGFGAAAWWIGGKSTALFLCTTMLSLVLEFIGMIPLLVAAFRKFDPSVDTPA